MLCALSNCDCAGSLGFSDIGKNTQNQDKEPTGGGGAVNDTCECQQATLKKMANGVLVCHLLETEGGLGEIGNEKMGNLGLGIRNVKRMDIR